uniref:Fibronectin type-III domain-containing protein n=1 Tax=Mesocestoides corti TaxID=53468 RepID=A0A5K3EHD2_MESCO
APSAPTGLLVNSVTETSIAVSWQPPIKPNGQISGYIVTLVEEQQTKDTTELTHTFQGLKSAHRYTIQVQAKNTMTGPAASVRVTTKPSADQKPAPPAMSQDVDMSPLGARVKWTAVPLATGYRVSYWPEGQENMGNSKVVGAETSALLTGLNKGEKYMANVVAFTYLVTSDASNTISFIYDNGIPNLPSNLMAKVVGIGMIHVTWDKPKTRAETEINAEVYKGSSSVRSVKGPESSGLLEISELPAFSVLAVKVWATKDGYKSAEKFFDGLETPPPAPEPPASVASEGVSASSIKITWQLPPDNTFIESSEVTVKESSTNEMSFTDSFKKSVDSVQVDKLKPYTVYNVDLKTKSYKYEGLSGNAESAVVSTTTQTWPTGPAEVGIPDQAVQLTADGGVKATWSPPTELIGEVERYYVRAVNNANSGSLGEQSSSGDVTSATFTGIPGKTQVAVYVRTGVKPAMGGVGGFESNDVLLGLVTTPDNGIVGDYSGGLSGGAIAGIVIAILIVLIILAIVVYKMTKGNQVEEVEFEWSEDGGDNGDDAQNGPRDKIELREGAKAPEVKAPEVKAPEVKAPEVKAPEVKAPEVKASEVKAPEVKLDRNEVAF